MWITLCFLNLLSSVDNRHLSFKVWPNVFGVVPEILSARTRRDADQTLPVWCWCWKPSCRNRWASSKRHKRLSGFGIIKRRQLEVGDTGMFSMEWGLDKERRKEVEKGLSITVSVRALRWFSFPCVLTTSSFWMTVQYPFWFFNLRIMFLLLKLHRSYACVAAVGGRDDIGGRTV